MAGKADVQTHLDSRRSALEHTFNEWAQPDVHAVERAAIIDDYFAEADVGFPQRVGNGTSVLVKAPRRDGRTANVLVVGRHGISDLSDRKAENAAEAGPIGPGVATRLGPTIAFCEGVQAARKVTIEDPINVTYLSLGEGDTYANVASSLFTGSLDAVFVTHAANWSPAHPTITTGCRGQVVAELTLTAGADLADFAVSGGVRNPLTKMVQLLGRLRDTRGRIVLDGFYDGAIAPDDDARSALTADGHDPNQWAEPLQIAASRGKLSSLERAALWPGVSVLSLATSSSDGVSSPGTVTATVALYLVPNQRHAAVERSLRSWFKSNAPADLQPKVRLLNSARPFQAPSDSVPVAAQTRAAYRLFGRQPILVPAGGHAGAGELAFAIGVPTGFAGIAPLSTSSDTLTEQVLWTDFAYGVAMAAETSLQLRRA